MVPKYLEGKTAKEILNEVRGRFLYKKTHTPETLCIEGYCVYLESLLVLGITEALQNCDGQFRVDELINKIGDGPEERAIVFLNTILPK